MAASYRIPAVEKFDFAKPEEWPRWIRRFKRFRQASELTNKTQEAQISTLVYSLGDKAENILSSFNLKEDGLKEYDTVRRKFESYFVKRRNTIYERVRFNSRNRQRTKAWMSLSPIYTDSQKTADTELCMMNWCETESWSVSRTANCQRSCR